jgi:hypothetical protein
MSGDYSRLTFWRDKGYSAVLAQQGRVLLDSDFNEQVAIYAYLGRRLAADLIGRHAGPVLNNQLGEPLKELFYSFEIKPNAGQGGGPPDLSIGPGLYYVDGIMIDATPPVPLDPVPSDKSGTSPGSSSGSEWTYWTQPDAYLDQENQADLLPVSYPYLVYVKVSERFISAVEDPDILETALGPMLPDTTGRAKVTWQVLPIRDSDNFTKPQQLDAPDLRDAFDSWADGRAAPAAWLAAQTVSPKTLNDPCTVAPDSRYRGPENQLYRVEVHRGGTAGKDAAASATFKWSRENGSVIFPIGAIEGTWVSLAALGRDDKLDLNAEDWVEVVDDAYLAHDTADSLLQVAEVDVPGRRVRLSAEPDSAVGRIAQRHPYLRRWDLQAATGRGAPRLWDGAVQIKEGSWTDLEDGVQVWFKPGGTYRTGDYWMIPARTLTGDVIWPQDASGTPLLQAPAGIEYHYAPLGWVTGTDSGAVTDLRQRFGTLAVPPH